MEKYIIIDTRVKKAIYGIGTFTMLLSTKETAEELANNLFEKKEDYIIICIKLKN